MSGMFSSCRFPFENICFLAWLTLCNSLVLSYSSTTNRWRTSIMADSGKHTSGSSIMSRNAFVTCGYAAHVFQAFVFPLPEKNDTQTHPVNAWKAGKALEHCGPSSTAIVWAARYLKCFPTPKAIHSSSTAVDWTQETASTTTSVSVVLIMILFKPSLAQ